MLTVFFYYFNIDNLSLANMCVKNKIKNCFWTSQTLAKLVNLMGSKDIKILTMNMNLEYNFRGLYDFLLFFARIKAAGEFGPS